jgi:ribose 5-phosphate isomerase B
MAAALLTSALAAAGGSRSKRYAVKSAGLQVSLPGAPASEHAVSAMAERGISLAGHRARQLGVADVAGADLILTMTAAHKAQIAGRWPGAREKVFTLGEYTGETATGTMGIVHDPMGGGLAAYRSCAAGLASMIAKLVVLVHLEEESAMPHAAPPQCTSAVVDTVLAELPLAVAVATAPAPAARVVARLAAGADHAGYILKDQLVAAVKAMGIEVEDLGTNGPASVDYPDFAALVGQAVASGRCQAGLLVCGTGLGMAIAANKVSGIRAVTCNDLYTARLAREHNDANVLCLGARVVAFELASEIVSTFLHTPFGAGRHIKRVSRIADLEGQSSGDLLGKGW